MLPFSVTVEMLCAARSEADAAARGARLAELGRQHCRLLEPAHVEATRLSPAAVMAGSALSVALTNGSGEYGPAASRLDEAEAYDALATVHGDDGARAALAEIRGDLGYLPRAVATALCSAVRASNGRAAA